MSGGPISFDELAARLKTAAQAELFSINQLELLAAKPESATLRQLTVDEARRQAEALGRAHEIACAIARSPFLALLFTPTKAGA